MMNLLHGLRKYTIIYVSESRGTSNSIAIAKEQKKNTLILYY